MSSEKFPDYVCMSKRMKAVLDRLDEHGIPYRVITFADCSQACFEELSEAMHAGAAVVVKADPLITSPNGSEIVQRIVDTMTGMVIYAGWSAMQVDGFSFAAYPEESGVGVCFSAVPEEWKNIIVQLDADGNVVREG